MRFQWECGSGKAILLLSAYFTVVLSLFLIRSGVWLSPGPGLRGVFLFAVPGLGLYAAAMVAGTFLLWPYFGKAVFIPLILISGFLLTATVSLDITLDGKALDSLLSAARRPGTVLGGWGAVILAISGILPAIALFLTHIEYRPLLGEVFLRGLLAAVGCVVLLLVAMLSHQSVHDRPRRGLRLKRRRLATLAMPSQGRSIALRAIHGADAGLKTHSPDHAS